MIAVQEFTEGLKTKKQPESVAIIIRCFVILFLELWR